MFDQRLPARQKPHAATARKHTVSCTIFNSEFLAVLTHSHAMHVKGICNIAILEVSKLSKLLLIHDTQSLFLQALELTPDEVFGSLGGRAAGNLETPTSVRLVHV